MTDQGELIDVARGLVEEGAEPDRVARALLRRTTSPVAAVGALSHATGIGLADAKRVVHHNLQTQVREAAERLWTDLADDLDPHGWHRSVRR